MATRSDRGGELGTFDGLHRIEVDRKGHLFTGASGSGKSSLLDAVSAVLTPDRWLRFNVAAQDTSSRGDDRGLVSYVRGAWSKEEAENEARTVARYLRPRAIWSGILLRYENGVDEPVTLVRLFHIPGSSTNKADLKDACIFAREPLELESLAPYAYRGIDVRELKKDLPGIFVSSSGSHAGFYGRMRRTFGIENERALQLLHKTQSAKNLGSLDQLFREFMLDRPSTFNRAENATEQFSELRQAHQYVVELRKQAEHLKKLAAIIDDYEKAGAAHAELTLLQEQQDLFQHLFGLELAQAEREATTLRLTASEAQANRARHDSEYAKEVLRAAERRMLELGGGDVGLLQQSVEDARKQAKQVEHAVQQFKQELVRAEISTTVRSSSDLAELQQAAQRTLAQTSAAPASDHSLNAEYAAAKQLINDLDIELKALKTRRSNIPPGLLAARVRICELAGLNEQQLPFAGELLSVRPEFAEWTGAIERVLRSFALTLLVPDDQLTRVRAIIEKMHLGVRLQYEAIPTFVEQPVRARDGRSLIHRVEVSQGPFHQWMQTKLSKSYDIPCVNSPEELDDNERGVTIAGQIKHAARRYEKDDRHRIDDRGQWVLGADNDAKVELLLDRRRKAAEQYAAAEAKLQDLDQQRAREIGKQDSLRRICAVTWGTIDLNGAQRTIRERQEQVELLARPGTDLAAATQEAETARTTADDAEEAYRDAAVGLERLRQEIKTLNQLIAAGENNVVGQTLDPAVRAELDRRFRSKQRKIGREDLADIGMKVAKDLRQAVNVEESKRIRAHGQYVQSVSDFKNMWPSAAADLTVDVEDRSGYLQLLTKIEVRGLPEHEQNFLRLLREKSRDLIGLLLSDLREAPKLVEERVDPVNASLQRSPFDEGRILQLQVKTQRSSEVKKFMDDLRAIVDGSWEDEGLEESERRYAVLEQVMNDLSSDEQAMKSWRNRVLDTRQHVTFLAQEIDRAHHVVNVHDSSAGLSGGQRQKLVIFCLAAALRYQLTTDDGERPTYGTIILDEAFDKADNNYTRMAMDVFVEFGFHMLLATPQKLLQVLEPYIGAITQVANPTRDGSTLGDIPIRAGQP